MIRFCGACFGKRGTGIWTAATPGAKTGTSQSLQSLNIASGLIAAHVVGPARLILLQLRFGNQVVVVPYGTRRTRCGI
jgi:hypothetical protein